MLTFNLRRYVLFLQDLFLIQRISKGFRCGGEVHHHRHRDNRHNHNHHHQHHDIIIIIIMIIIIKSSTHHCHDNQIAYIGVISPAHKELVHLMLDAGKVCFCKLILMSIDCNKRMISLCKCAGSSL